MRIDERGIGGFVEDLPVLVFVLAGAVAVISTTSWVIEVRADAREQTAADALAADLIDALLFDLSEGGVRSVLISELRALNATTIQKYVADELDWALAILVMHPWTESVEVTSDGCVMDTANVVGYANRMMTAQYDAGAYAFVEVRCVVASAS